MRFPKPFISLFFVSLFLVACGGGTNSNKADKLVETTANTTTPATDEDSADTSSKVSTSDTESTAESNQTVQNQDRKSVV